MLSVIPLQVPFDGWTVDDLPDDEYRRYELVDGALLVAPPRGAVRPQRDHRDRMEPQRVRLAVEVMSPSSVSTDRVAKPAQYAAAGIPHFWRLELDPLLLVVHRLEGEAYEVVGRYDDDEVALDEPVPVAFRLPSLLD